MNKKQQVYLKMLRHLSGHTCCFYSYSYFYSVMSPKNISFPVFALLECWL